MKNDLQNLMCEYFQGGTLLDDRDECLIDFLPQAIVQHEKIPVKPQEANWRVVESPNRLMKTYNFQTQKEVMLFIQDLLEFQEEFNHHAKITINYHEVIIEVYTHDVDDVTELDKEYAVVADAIYSDIEILEFDGDTEETYTEY